MQVATLLALVLTAGGPGSEVTPVDAATSSVVAYVTSLGLAGILALALFWLYVFPGKLTERARAEARADLLKENERLTARAERAEARAEEALNISSEKILPILANFVSVSGSLVPVLQQLVAVMPLLQQFLAQRRDP